MPAKQRHKTKYQGVTYISGVNSRSSKAERIYYIRYRRDGKLVEEKAGRQFVDHMTPAKAAQIRARRIAGDDMPNRERRAKEAAKRKAEKDTWTIARLWESYSDFRKPGKSLDIDTGRYKKYIKPALSKKEPKDIISLDVQRLRKGLERKKLSAQTVHHVLNLLTWIINYGTKNALCEGLKFKISKPSVNNIVTEDLTQDQLQVLLKAIDKSTNIQVANMMRLILHSGMRRGELFRLNWSDLDFERGFIKLRDPKGGPDQTIPMSDGAREILNSHPRTGSKYVFPGKDGKQRVSCQQAVNKIKKAAGLPKGFRPMHGLRHFWASSLASSGQVDLYTLQRLLTHKDPRMTQRYAHLRDEALKKASNVAGDIIRQATEPKVVSINERRKKDQPL